MARDYTITQQGYSKTFTVTTCGGGGGGAGDMLAATYDPTSVEGDAFSMDNMVEGADSKVLTAAERAAITSNGNQLSYHSGRLASVEALAGANSLSVQVNDASITSHTSETSNPHSVTATQVGLGNVDNTADADKPVSTAQQTALDDKQDILAEGAFVDGDKTRLDKSVISDTAGVTGADQVTNLISLTQAEYDAITPGASTLYIITD